MFLHVPVQFLFPETFPQKSDPNIKHFKSRSEILPQQCKGRYRLADTEAELKFVFLRVTFGGSPFLPTFLTHTGGSPPGPDLVPVLRCPGGHTCSGKAATPHNHTWGKFTSHLTCAARAVNSPDTSRPVHRAVTGVFFFEKLWRDPIFYFFSRKKMRESPSSPHPYTR